MCLIVLIFLTVLNRPISKVWGSASRAQRPLHRGALWGNDYCQGALRDVTMEEARDMALVSITIFVSQLKNTHDFIAIVSFPIILFWFGNKEKEHKSRDMGCAKSTPHWWTVFMILQRKAWQRNFFVDTKTSPCCSRHIMVWTYHVPQVVIADLVPNAGFNIIVFTWYEIWNCNTSCWDSILLFSNTSGPYLTDFSENWSTPGVGVSAGTTVESPHLTAPKEVH